MRVLSWLLFLLALIIGGCAILLYLYAAGMACAYSTSGGECGIKWPWQLGREDIIVMILIPGSLVALLVWGGLALRRMSRPTSGSGKVNQALQKSLRFAPASSRGSNSKVV